MEKIINSVLIKNGLTPLPLSGRENLDQVLELALSTYRKNDMDIATHKHSRGKFRFNDLQNLINIDDKKINILDFGCGDCSLALS